MEILNVYDNEYPQNFGSTTDIAVWNGREISISRRRESCCHTINFQALVDPLMSRPSNVEGELTGGYSEEKGAYIEGRITGSWGDSNSSKSYEPKEKEKSSDNSNSENN